MNIERKGKKEGENRKKWKFNHLERNTFADT